MTVREHLDALIDEQQGQGKARIDIFLGADAKAVLKEELRPFLTHRTEYWRVESYRGCEIKTIDGDGVYVVAYGDSLA